MTVTTTDTRTPFARSRNIPTDRLPRDLDQEPAPPGTSFGVRGGGGAGAQDWVASSSDRIKVDMQKLTEKTELDLVEETRTNVRKWTYGEMKKVAADVAKFMPPIPDDVSGPGARAIIEASLADMLHNWAISGSEPMDEPTETSLVPGDSPDTSLARVEDERRCG